MISKMHSWWKNIKQQPLAAAVIIIVGVLGIALIVIIFLGYWLNWDWTGLGPYNPPTKDNSFQRGKTLWDWLQLLIIPLVIAAGTLWFNARQSQTSFQVNEKQHQTDLEIAADQQEETALKDYLDRMSELLLDKKLSDPTAGVEVRELARARTLTALRRLGPNRKGVLLQFLYDTGLINKYNAIIVLSSAPDWLDLRVADLSKAHLRGADLHEASLSRVNLREADLREAILERADLNGVDLSRAILGLLDPFYPDNLGYLDMRRTRLSGANLSGADLSEADLRRTDFIETDLSGSTLNKVDLRGAHLERAHLNGADLIEAKLSNAFLNNADLSGANLQKADLRGAVLRDVILVGDLSRISAKAPEGFDLANGADLSEADLRGADLSGADLSGANLDRTNLDGTNLIRAKVTADQLAKARSRQGTIMPDGSIHS